MALGAFDEILATVGPLCAKGRLPAVILWQGRAGIGKRELVKAVFSLFMCREKTGCGVCGGCRQVAAGTHPELLWPLSRVPVHG